MITWIMTAIAIIGTILNSFQKRSGFYFWLIGNLFWVIYNYKNEMPAQSALYLFNSIMCIIGLIKWKNNKEDK